MPSKSNARSAAPKSRRSLERLLSADEVAEFLRIPVSTLYQWRHRGCGPEAYRVGRHLRYDPSAVQAWLDDHRAEQRGVG